jgi:hypothetical protein
LWLREILWDDKFILKIQKKHNVRVEEVDESTYHFGKGYDN